MYETDEENIIVNDVNVNGDDLNFISVDNITESNICRLCNKPFESRLDLNQHIVKTHNGLIETCEMCHISFLDKNHCAEHKKKHVTRKENVFRCSLCPQAFFNKSKLAYHEINHGADRTDHGVHLKINNVHSVVLPAHSNEYVGYENMFTCDVCSKSFQIKKNLDRHKKIHESAKDDDKNSKNKSLLKFLYCKYCSKLFINRENLAKHVAAHEESEKKKKYACKYCPKRYLIPTMLFTHFRKAHKHETPFVCLACNKYFNKRPDFSLHIKDVHQNVGSIKFDKNSSIVYGESAITTDLEASDINNISFDINVNSIDNYLSTDDFDLDSNNFEEMGLDTDCFNTVKNNDLVDMFANIESNTSNDSYVSFNDDILDILDSAKPDEIPNENPEPVIPIEEVLIPNTSAKISKDSDESSEAILRIEETDDDTMECNICGVNLKKKSIKNHLLLHYNKTVQKFKCYICAVSFRTKIKLDIHVRDHFKNDKTLCACGVKCKNDEDMKKHKVDCSNFLSSKPNADGNTDSLNEDSILIFDAEKSTCLILKDSAENRNYVKKNIHNIEQVYKNSMSPERSSPIFREPINIPNPTVTVRRITQEEAKTKPKLNIKSVSIDDGNSSKPESSTSRIRIHRISETVNSPKSSCDKERILVNVNPLAHLLKEQEKSFIEKKSTSKKRKLDYASIIEKSLNDIVIVKKNK